MTATNSEEYIIPPIGGGFGNMKVAALKTTIETYVTGGYVVKANSVGYDVLSVVSEKAQYTPKAEVQANGSIKVKVYAVKYIAEPAGIAWAEVNAATDVGEVTIWLVGK